MPLRPGLQRDRFVLADRAEFPAPQSAGELVRAKTLLGARVADLMIALERATVVSVVIESDSGERHTVAFSDFAGTASQGR